MSEFSDLEIFTRRDILKGVAAGGLLPFGFGGKKKAELAMSDQRRARRIIFLRWSRFFAHRLIRYGVADRAMTPVKSLAST